MASRRCSASHPADGVVARLPASTSSSIVLASAATVRPLVGRRPVLDDGARPPRGIERDADALAGSASRPRLIAASDAASPRCDGASSRVAWSSDIPDRGGHLRLAASDAGPTVPSAPIAARTAMPAVPRGWSPRSAADLGRSDQRGATAARRDRAAARRARRGRPDTPSSSRRPSRDLRVSSVTPLDPHRRVRTRASGHPAALGDRRIARPSANAARAIPMPVRPSRSTPDVAVLAMAATPDVADQATPGHAPSPSDRRTGRPATAWSASVRSGRHGPRPMRSVERRRRPQGHRLAALMFVAPGARAAALTAAAVGSYRR